MTTYLDANGREIRPGQMLVWQERGTWHAGRVEADPKWTGGMRINGRSVAALIEAAEWVTVVT